jgi:hypothetical protein
MLATVSLQNLLTSHLLSKNVRIRIYETIIFMLVLCGHDTWSLILMEENRLRVLENRVLRRILGPRRDQIMEDWRKMHNEDFCSLYSSPSI